VTIEGVYLKQGRGGSEALIQVLGDENSTVTIENCEIDVKALIVNNRPTNLRLLKSFVSLGQTQYLINSKHTMNVSSSLELVNTVFRGF